MIERRFSKGAEVRAKGDTAKPGLEGYAAVFGEEYVLYEDTGYRMVESIKKGAFGRVLDESQDVRCLFNHSADNVLARTTNGTLSMKQDSKGLKYDADLDSRTRIGQDVRCFVDRGDVTGCSFAFTVSKQVWREEQSKDGKLTTYTREIEEIENLYDVGPVTYPAYEGTSVGARTAANLAETRSRILSIDGIPKELRTRIERASKECDCRCAPCADGTCTDCPGDNEACGDEENCRCSGRAAGVSDEQALAQARTRMAEISL